MRARNESERLRVSALMGGKAKQRIKDTASLGVLVLAMLTARGSLADHYRVPSGSMEPTLQIGDRIVVDKSAYGWRIPMTSIYVGGTSGPNRGDVSILESPVDGTTLVKRVVAVPGDRVAVHHGRLIINGQWVPVKKGGSSELYWEERLDDHPHFIQPGGPNFGPVTLPEDRYLVMGDNRKNSLDGRTFGLVSGSSFLGRATKVYFRHGDFAWLSL